MNEKDVQLKIATTIRAFAGEQGHQIGLVPATALLGKDFGMSSIDLVHLLVRLEEAFQKEFSLEDIMVRGIDDRPEDVSVGRLLRYVCGRLAVPMAAPE